MPEAGVNMEQDPLVGKTLGGCRILRRIGRGGMGVVYEAEQTSLRRIVALKVPLPSLMAEDRTYAERFLREARTAARLNDPNVVQVHDAGTDGQYYYMIMEFVDGEGLDKRIRRKATLPVSEALAITLQAARGLAAAHRVDLIHRDIKPSNFLITQKGIVKLADFGLAKAVMGVPDLTFSSAVVGTPEYMSPEQCKGEELDPRSDIYSLGTSLYEMLTGRRPFDAQTKVAVMYKHVHEPIPTDLRRMPGISASVAAIVERMLAKRPEERFQSAEELIAALKPILREPQPDARLLAPERPAMASVPGAAPAVERPPAGDGTEGAIRAQQEALERWRELKRRKQLIARCALLSAGALAVGVLILVLVASAARPNRDRRPDGTGGLPTPPVWAKVSLRQRQMAHQAGVPVAIEMPLEGAQPLRLVYVAPGEFTMGATTFDSVRPHDELPPHRVRITRGFYLGMCEVTAGQWKAVMGRDPSDFGTDHTPVECVTWLDCQDFIERLNRLQRGARVFRFPTEAEWEYACRAGTTTEYPWGNGIRGCARHSNVADESAEEGIPGIEHAQGERDGSVHTAPVGSYEPNAWGLYDMIGNVQEWCQDYYSRTYYSTSPVDDPPGPPRGRDRVSRGGCWASKPTSCRSAFRMGIPPGLDETNRSAMNMLGLRLASDAVQGMAGK
ncbi:MAG: hypothetical protein FJ290_21155 [Planctomycetes bacterium]|nr:hypothetical protein [Planctomycetota bacterium]